MTDLAKEMNPVRKYWVGGNLKMVATGLTGLIAIFVALKATAYNAGGVVGIDAAGGRGRMSASCLNCA